jgi:hypothetical protein
MSKAGSASRCDAGSDRPKPWQVILLCTATACIYGVLHDQITIRVSPEYFTLAHPRLFPTSDPTLLAFCWGIAGSWWIGAAFGLVLALILKGATFPRVPTLRIARRLLGLFAISAAAALFAGWVGYEVFSHSFLVPPDAVREADPSMDRNRFMAAWFAHLASYVLGGAGGILLLLRFWRECGRPHVLALFPDNKSGVVRAVVLSTCVVALIYWRLAAP